MISRTTVLRRCFSPWGIACVLAATVCVLSSRATAQEAPKQITVKMATLVPTNTSWFLSLKEVADQWNKLSNGRVRIILYGGATKGDDPEVVQAMRLGVRLMVYNNSVAGTMDEHGKPQTQLVV